MTLRLYIITIALLLSSINVAASQKWVEKNTIDNLCQKVNCHDQLKEYYNKYYFTKTFHKALVVSYYKSGNEYINDYFGYSFEEKNSADARMKAITMCNKHGKKCELLLLNNEVQNKELYNKLTKSNSSYSSSSVNIPSNAYKSGNSWKCKSGYYKNKTYCAKLSEGAVANNTSGFFCKSGYRKSGLQCIKSSKKNIPVHAKPSSNDQGWKCGTFYYQKNNMCEWLPSNGIAYSNKEGFFCKSGFRKSTAKNLCISKLIVPSNAFALSSSSWACKAGFYRKNNYCSKLPLNASANKNNSDGYFCNDGYNKNVSQNKCVLKNTMIPSGAIASSNAQGWKCWSGNYETDNKCKRLPLYAIANSEGKGFYCKPGFRKSSAQNKCIKQTKSKYIPENGYALGSGWKCYSEFVKVGNSCLLAIKNGRYNHNGKSIFCDTGYVLKANGQGCYKKTIPDNAYAFNDTWKCNSNFYKYGDSCFRLPSNAYANNIEGFTCNSGYVWEWRQERGSSCYESAKTAKIKQEENQKLKNQSNIVENDMEVEFWSSIKDNNDPDEYQIYLDEYPNGKYAKLAKYRIEKFDSISTSENSSSLSKLNFGNYHALVIGNDKYKHLSPLTNAVNDANDVASVLRSKYNFNVNLLTNATRDEIVSALSDLRSSISSSDNLLVYYAGHGELDKKADEGFWLPVDAESDNQVHWVANETIMRSVRAMEAKHVMVVADSCFSGTMTRGIKIKDNSPDYIKKIVKKKARTVLTSGGLEPVSDVGGGNNSVFALSFLNALKNNDGVLDGNQLFSIVRKQVMLNSKQTPEYGDIRRAGHDGGDFVFVSR
jgi:hypothetical protein